MRWTAEQDRALAAFGRWYRERPSPWFYLAGYAGTGKTTLARHLAAGVDGRVEFGAPTGKAAQVLRRKGCAGATTLHRLIYRASERSRARVTELEQELERARQEYQSGFTPAPAGWQYVKAAERALAEARRVANSPAFAVNPDAQLRCASLLVLDECSMVDERLALDALSFDVPVLCLGDPAQLPPVGGPGFFSQRAPDAQLEDVQRQALDSPVLALATRVRRGLPLTPGDCSVGDDDFALVKPYAALTADDALAADVILTGHNATRRRWNRRLRELLGYAGDLPRKGERLLVLNNRHDLGLVNGSEVVATSDAVYEAGEVRVEIDGPDLDDGPLEVTAPRLPFDRYCDPNLQDERRPWERREHVDLDFAYCLTVHKAQGSEWDRVLVADDGFGRGDRTKWLYTAITRAARSIVVGLST